MNLILTATIITLIIIFSGCLHVPSGTINDAKKTDFAGISYKLLDMKQRRIIDSLVITENIPDADTRKTLLDLKIGSVYIAGVSRWQGMEDSVITYYQPNKNISIRLYQWEKGTEIIYDYAKRMRDLSEEKDEFSSATKKINKRLYIRKYKEPTTR